MSTKDKIKAMIQNQDTEVLQHIATKLMNDFREGSTIVFDNVISELESRMTEQEYIKFCETI